MFDDQSIFLVLHGFGMNHDADFPAAQTDQEDLEKLLEEVDNASHAEDQVTVILGRSDQAASCSTEAQLFGMKDGVKYVKSYRSFKIVNLCEPFKVANAQTTFFFQLLWLLVAYRCRLNLTSATSGAHRLVLCSRSGFFCSALKANFLEQRQRQVRLGLVEEKQSGETVGL